MYTRNFFEKASKSLAAFTAAACAAVMSAVSYYNCTLPDSYSRAIGENFSTLPACALPVTAEYLSSDSAVFSSIESDVKNMSLKLFGSVPIKNVSETVTVRPMLAAGGFAFGIRLVTDGVMIIDMKNLSGVCPAKEAGLKIGDVIESINGERVTTNSRVSEIIKESDGKECNVKYRRGEKEKECSIKPVLSEGSYRAGMWVRDSSAGIGTMTFFDPETLSFAGLGHAICDSDTHEPLPLSEGSISDVEISGCKKSGTGDPGQLHGEFVGGETGELTANCSGGVYGNFYQLPEEYVVYPMAYSQEVHEGKACILTQTGSGDAERYEIIIEKTDLSDDAEHDMVIKVTDEKLISITGGIVQGMSGSPIIQDGMIAGAVTHVFIDDPLGGYGIFAEEMYEYSKKADG